MNKIEQYGNEVREMVIKPEKECNLISIKRRNKKLAKMYYQVCLEKRILQEAMEGKL